MEVIYDTLKEVEGSCRRIAICSDTQEVLKDIQQKVPFLMSAAGAVQITITAGQESK